MTHKHINLDDYDHSQQEEIRNALKDHINIAPYLDISYHSACIHEIAMGLKHHLDITPYAKPCYTWRKMKEIRLGLSKGLDVSCYKSLMYTAKEMKKRRLWILKHSKSHWAAENMTVICADDYEALTSIAQTYQTITDDTPKDQNTLIAKGTYPVDGKDGYYVFQFHTKKCHISNLPEDGSIDFDHLNWYETVSKNQILAYYHPTTQAIDGKTVTGRMVPAIRGKEKPILKGSGFTLFLDQLSPSDEQLKAVITQLTKSYEDACKKNPNQNSTESELFITTKDTLYQKDLELSAAYKKADQTRKTYR